MIRFINTSAVASATSGNVTVTPPTTVSDDIMVCPVSNNGTSGASFPAGWTTVISVTTGSITATVAWKRAVGAEGSFTLTNNGGGEIVSRISNYRGCSRDAGLISFSDSNSVTATLCSAGLESTDANCMLVFTNHTVANTTGFSNFFIRNSSSNPRLRERFLQNGDTIGSGGNKTLLDLSDGILEFPRSGLLTATLSASAANIGAVLALRPEKALIFESGKLAFYPPYVATGTL